MSEQPKQTQRSQHCKRFGNMSEDLWRPLSNSKENRKKINKNKQYTARQRERFDKKLIEWQTKQMEQLPQHPNEVNSNNNNNTNDDNNDDHHAIQLLTSYLTDKLIN